MKWRYTGVFEGGSGRGKWYNYINLKKLKYYFKIFNLCVYTCIYVYTIYPNMYLHISICVYVCILIYAQLLHTNICNTHIKQCIYFPFFSTHQGVDVIPSLDTEHMLNSLAGRRHKGIKHNFFSPRSYCLVDEPDCFSDYRMRHRLIGGRFVQGHLEEITLLGWRDLAKFHQKAPCELHTHE